ncbi:SLATT domain-containing protein [Planktothrix agardhii]|uniref:SLATT domain-containing protein n=1 Tax=Planktothrix agardhii TaxID=1160 RepID=UPI001D09F7D5|nr:SLATT domain-containing protein [Planktothrix agardhii]MCB8765840.1 SLATT domain-containing protein [Planktothrix agardhii 1809]MCB8783892.1 SLATT domain-containing protein [Planktothrix agardhii 1808]MCF3565085.1 SLATT domain-containing protein [Planktothrix agardhii 1807]
MTSSSSPDNSIDQPMNSSTGSEDSSNKPLPYVVQEDIIYRAVERKTVCRVLSQAHIDVSIRWSTAHLYIGIPSTILAAIASVQAINSLGGEYQLLSVVIAVLVAILAPLLTFLDPNGRANNHLNASRIYEQMADQYDSFILKCRLEPRSIKEEFDDLTQLNFTYSESKKNLPACPEWAYQKAINTNNSVQKLMPGAIKKIEKQ